MTAVTGVGWVDIGTVGFLDLEWAPTEPSAGGPRGTAGWRSGRVATPETGDRAGEERLTGDVRSARASGVRLL